MTFDKLTVKSQETIQQAHSLAGEKGHQAIEPIHFLGAMLQDGQGMAVSVFNKIGASPGQVADEVESAMAGMVPKASRVTNGPARKLASPRAGRNPSRYRISSILS